MCPFYHFTNVKAPNITIVNKVKYCTIFTFRNTYIALKSVNITLKLKKRRKKFGD